MPEITSVHALKFRGGVAYNPKARSLSGYLDDNRKGLLRGDLDSFSLTRTSGDRAPLLPFWGPLPNPDCMSRGLFSRFRNLRLSVAFEMVEAALYLHCIEREKAKPEELRLRMIDVDRQVERTTHALVHAFDERFLETLSRDEESETLVIGTQILACLQECAQGTEYEAALNRDDLDYLAESGVLAHAA